MFASPSHKLIYNYRHVNNERKSGLSDRDATRNKVEFDPETFSQHLETVLTFIGHFCVSLYTHRGMLIEPSQGSPLGHLYRPQSGIE
jgi:hypothetical protein